MMGVVLMLTSVKSVRSNSHAYVRVHVTSNNVVSIPLEASITDYDKKRSGGHVYLMFDQVGRHVHVDSPRPRVCTLGHPARR